MNCKIQDAPRYAQRNFQGGIKLNVVDGQMYLIPPWAKGTMTWGTGVVQGRDTRVLGQWQGKVQ